MTPKTKKILLISGGVVVLGLVFFWWKSRQTAAVAGTSAGSTPVGSATTPVSAASARAIAQQWAAGHNDAGWVSAVNAMTDAEALQLAPIIQKYLQPGGPGAYAMNGQEGQFWQAFTTKYNVR